MAKLVFDFVPLEHIQGDMGGYRLEPCSEKQALDGDIRSYVKDLSTCIRFGIPCSTGSEPLVSLGDEIYVILSCNCGDGEIFTQFARLVVCPTQVIKTISGRRYELQLN
jgi:hypothetical protein